MSEQVEQRMVRNHPVRRNLSYENHWVNLNTLLYLGGGDHLGK